MHTRILIVDDDPRFRALARTLLEAAGYLTSTASRWRGSYARPTAAYGSC
jgi:CheY-like chemotaxis protein